MFSIKGELKPFRGRIAYVSSDNLGSEEVGGFKIGPAANLKCRECMGLSHDLETKVLCKNIFNITAKISKIAGNFL